MKKNSGFTLIELLVVIAIIGTLLSLILISFRDANARSRDTRRVADIKSFQDALALYQIQNVTYPLQETEAEITGLDVFSQAILNERLIPQIPKDPSYLNAAYKYFYQSDGKAYTIRYCQETGFIQGRVQSCENRVSP